MKFFTGDTSLIAEELAFKISCCLNVTEAAWGWMNSFSHNYKNVTFWRHVLWKRQDIDKGKGYLETSEQKYVLLNEQMMVCTVKC